VKPADI